MEATKGITMRCAKRRLRMAGDLLWFATASLAAGLLAAMAAAVLVILLAQSAYALSPAPRLVVPGAESPIVLQNLSIRAEITGSVARTTVEMVFYNPNRRPLEGELQFPLLDGQQVTGFALDIDGKLREAVVVEKSRGQQVFEDITRQRVDPGLLQVTEGNSFKLRVYPIFAQRTRTVAITYSENLAMRGARGIYKLPLEYGAKVGEFSLQIDVRGAGAALSGAAARDLALAGDGKGKGFKTKRTHYQPRGILEVAVNVAPGTRVITQRVDSRQYFYAEVPVQSRKVKRALPSTIGLIWDSSASGAARNHARELALLEAYFAAVRNAEVQLVHVRDTVESAERFRIVDGRWPELRRALEQTVYDGATNLGAFVPDPLVKEYLLFSDGLVNYGESAFPQVGVPVYAISSSTQSNPAWLKHVAQRSGGRYLDLATDTPGAVIERLTFDFERIRSITSNGAVQLLASSPHPVNGMLAVTGILTEPAADVRVELGLPGRRPRTVTWRVNEGANDSAYAASFWARERIAELAADYDNNRGEILRLGRSFGLVTRETSLIVLETIQDYVRFEIEPPGELTAQYERMRQGTRRVQPADPQQKIERVVAMLNNKEAWWKREFPKGPVAVASPQAHLGTFVPRAREPERKDGYLTDSQGEIVRAPGSGACMRSEQWTPALAVSECEPNVNPGPPRWAAAPAPKPAPPPQPAMKPMAKPKPAMADMRQPTQVSSGESSATRVAARAWSPEAPYRARLANAEAADLYRLYLDERPGYSTAAAFYLDVADILMAKGLQPLAMRVLSNLAEIGLEDRHTLRSLAQRLMQAGEHRLAVGTYKRVMQISPEEPQSFRDLGLAYAAAGERQRAIDTLYEVVVRSWHVRFPEIELIALADLNAIVAAATPKLDVSRIDSRLLRNMPVDLRIVLTWDSDNTNVDLQVTDPNGQTGYPGGAFTFQGGRMSHNFSGGYGPEEYSLRVAKPGTYRVSARFSGQNRQVVGAGPVYAHVHVYTKFGTSEQTVRTHNVMLNRVGSAPVVTEITVPGQIEDH